MNLQFHFTECKPASKPRRRAYRRKVATKAKAKTKLLINTLRHAEFINAQQSDVLLALLGVAS